MTRLPWREVVTTNAAVQVAKRLGPSKNATERKKDQEREEECRRSADIRGMDSPPEIQGHVGDFVLNNKSVGGGIERRGYASPSAGRDC